MMRQRANGFRTAAACWSLTWAALCAVALCAAPIAARAQEQNSPSDKKSPPAARAPAKQCVPFRIRPQDQLWAVSTRHLGCNCSATEEPGWRMWRYDHEKKIWQPATIAEFYATDSPEVVTTFFIHGNRIDHNLAFSDGMDVYFQLVGKSDEEKPVRFVIWSWPSSQIKGPLNDIRSKAWRTDIDGYYLARFLAGMNAEVRVGLLGYSYGARIITGGLHLLGGGTLAGRTVPPGERPQIRAALWAAALHNHWLLPEHYHGQALGLADRWLITYNCCDPVLSRYQWIEKCADPVALGYSGLYGRNLLPPELNERVEEMDVSGLIGGTHDMQAYLYSPSIQERTRQYVLWHELETSPSAPGLQTALAPAR